ncbi:MAG: DUF6531 domain-containing protein, partial [Actinobacteria bacterium]|nr:DUF6531 domain-containing protein [Actinomycetota bacterium]
VVSLATRSVTRISNQACSATCQPASNPSISFDGSKIVYQRFSDGPSSTVYLYDTSTKATILVDGPAPEASHASVWSSGSTVSVAYERTGQLWVKRDLLGTAPSMTEVSLKSTGGESDYQSSDWPQISADGQGVAFVSNSGGLVPQGTGGVDNVYFRNLGSGSTSKVSIDSNRRSRYQNSGTGERPAVAIGGGATGAHPYIAFKSAASFTPDDNNSLSDVYIRDLDDTSPCGIEVSGTAPSCIEGPTDRAYSDFVGLEKFYPYHSFSVGGGAAGYLNMATGNAVLQYLDLEVPSNGLNLRITRTYNSARKDLDEGLGKGWSLGISDSGDMGLNDLSQIGDGAVERGVNNESDVSDAALSIDPLSAIDVNNSASFDLTDGDGTRHHFVNGGIDGPGWHSPPGLSLKMTQPTGEYALYRPDGVSYHFTLQASTGLYHLASVQDRKSNTIAYSYGAEGNLTSVSDSSGHSVTFDYSSPTSTADAPHQHLRSLTYHHGALSYSVNYLVSNETFIASHPDPPIQVDSGPGVLYSATQATGTVDSRTFHYMGSDSSACAALLCPEDPLGNRTKLEGTEGVNDWVDRTNQTWMLDHGSSGCPSLSSGARSLCIKDPEGNVSDWTTSEYNNLIATKDAGDSNYSGAAFGDYDQRQFAWDNNRLVYKLDKTGNRYDYAWNDSGRLTASTRTGAGEKPVNSLFQYQDIDPVTQPGVSNLITATVTDSNGPSSRAWSFGYDAVGDVTQTVAPGNLVTRFGYYDKGMLKAITDPRNKTTVYGNPDPSMPDHGYDAREPMGIQPGIHTTLTTT